MKSKRTISIGLLTAIGLAGGVWWVGLRPPPRGETPANDVTATSPYVDDRDCAECHSRHAEVHRLSGHAGTFRTTVDNELAREFGGKIVEDPERGYAFHYHYDTREGLSVSVPQRFGNERFPLKFALGSGQHAVSFLSLVPDQRGDTAGIEHRITAYRGPAGWEFDLTPGHQRVIPGEPLEELGKVVRGDVLESCIGCHTTTAEILRQDLVDVRPSVGCQNCHGPGRDHVLAMRTGEDVRGRLQRTHNALEEIQLCGQCHRLPKNESVGQLSPNLLKNIRFQPAGLIQSQCYKKSADLRCSTCHDPHEHVSRNLDHYVARCVSCHGSEADKKCPVSPAADCIRCHMPAIDVHRGIEFHDHWIRARQ